MRSQTSRSDPTDVQSWYSVAAQLDLPHRWATSLQYRARMVDNASSYHGSYITAEAERGLGKHLALLGNYRLALVEGATAHRLGLGAEVSTRAGALALSFRPMVQVQRKFVAGEDEGEQDSYLRTRAQARYPLSKRFDVYGSVEPYFALGADHTLDNIRNTVGARWEFARGRRLGVFYIYRPDYVKSYDRTYHIIGVDLDLRWKVRSSPRS